MEYEDLDPILSIESARAKDARHGGVLEMKREQDPAAEARGERRRVRGSLHLGGQEHYYMETHGALVVPGGEKNEMTVVCSTQEPHPVQTQV